MSTLATLLEGDAIALDVQAPDSEAAIRLAGLLLEQTGVAEPAYTQAMVDNVAENGPYIVIAPGFAFAHARPSEAVHRTGLSWVRLADPVPFGHPTNDPVTLVVALAAKDDGAHTSAMAELAKVIGDPTRKAALDAAETAEAVLAILRGEEAPTAEPAAEEPAVAGGSDRHLVLTVCGNGLGTSLFLKNTLEQVLDRWKWSSFVTVEATDTISARGKAKDAELILTSGEIARTLGDVGIPVKVISNFTSTSELDAALRELYDV
ncbi:PTS sugar transporter subunit IIA [Aeromicrobium sp. Leaf350]|uniref:PTS sugar transporter subunit IIA n=1 Tax=Aeromicrobium sp. Leaf350 TaxID=2876565 RepID=UPI001E3AA259|nr:PTS sugar transporter subunit IIA [Aeromicrobium sp. Leaf350]